MESLLLVFNQNIPIKSAASYNVRIYFTSVSELWQLWSEKSCLHVIPYISQKSNYSKTLIKKYLKIF